MNDRAAMPAAMPAEIAERLSEQFFEEREARTEVQLDDAIEGAIAKRWSIGELVCPVEGYDYWTAKFHKALADAVLYKDPARYAELGKIVHHLAREAVREEI